MRIPSIVPGVSNLGEQFPTHFSSGIQMPYITVVFLLLLYMTAISKGMLAQTLGASFATSEVINVNKGCRCQISSPPFWFFSYGRVVKDGLGCIWFPMYWQPARKLHHGRPIACHCRFAQGAFPEHINTGWYPSLIAKEDTTLASLLPNDHKERAGYIQHYNIANEQGYYVAVVRPHFLACQGMCFN